MSWVLIFSACATPAKLSDPFEQSTAGLIIGKVATIFDK